MYWNVIIWIQEFKMVLELGSIDKVRNKTKDAFILCCNAAALPKYRLLIYRSLTQCTAPHLKFTSLQYRECSSRRGDGNTATATYRNAAAMDYERILKLRS